MGKKSVLFQELLRANEVRRGCKGAKKRIGGRGWEGDMKAERTTQTRTQSRKAGVYR